MNDATKTKPVLQMFASHFTGMWTVRSVVGTGNFPNFDRIGEIWRMSCPDIQIFLRQIPKPTLETGLDIKFHGTITSEQEAEFLQSLGAECVFSPALVVLHKISKAPFYLMKMRDNTSEYHDLDTAGYHLAFETAELMDSVLELTEKSIQVRNMTLADRQKLRDVQFRFGG